MKKIWKAFLLYILIWLWKRRSNDLRTCASGTFLIHSNSKIQQNRKIFTLFLFRNKHGLKKKLNKNRNHKKIGIDSSNAEAWKKNYNEVPNKKRKLIKNETSRDSRYIWQNISGISVFPLKQKDEKNQMKTQLPTKTFKPKQSLGQNYLRDFNIIQKIVESVEQKVETGNMKVTYERRDDKREKVKKKKKGKRKMQKKEKTTDKNNVQKKIEEDKVKPIEEKIEEQIPDKIEEKEENKIEENIEFESIRNGGNGVIELGCGLGQMTKYLFKKYHNMTGIEIDGRALSIISRTIPNFDIIHDDVLQINYKELSINKKTKLTVVGNLPFYITSQILFCLLDFSNYIEQAIVTIQYEVGKRIVAKPNTKSYSILSILFHLYANAFLLFKVPSKAFYPVPKVEAAVMRIIFKKQKTWNCHLLYLKHILKSAFQQKRKMLKTSLKEIIKKSHTKQIPPRFINSRPQQLLPLDFVDITNALFPPDMFPFDPIQNPKVWRKEKHGS